MAKRSTWVWVAAIIAVVFIVFALCVCAFVGIAWYSGKKAEEIKKQAAAARSASQEADEVLESLNVMNTLSPSSSSGVKKALAATEELDAAEQDLQTAKDDLLSASGAGPSGSMKQYVGYELDSTNDKLEIVKMRERQKTELASASKAAALAASGFSAMSRATSYLAKGTTYRNADKYGQAKSARAKGSALLARAVALYGSAKRQYPSANFRGVLAYIAKLKAMASHQASLDSLGARGRISQYNKIVPKANADRKAADKLYWGAISGGTASAVDRAYNSNVSALVDDIREKSGDAAAKDASAESVWSSLSQ